MWLIQSTKKGKETEGGKKLCPRHGLSNVSNMRALDKQGSPQKGKMKGTREALELRATREKHRVAETEKKLVSAVNTVGNTVFRFRIKGHHYYAYFARGLQ